jgi:DNA-binding response OmpR family regulator
VIAIVDDEENIRILLEKILKKGEYIILQARSGPALFEIMKNQKPDVILLDVMLPGVDGFQICKQLKAAPETADIPVIMLTVLSRPEDISQGLTAGATAYMTKPFDPRELEQEIALALKRV